MVEIEDKKKSEKKIPLKELAGVENLSKKDTALVLFTVKDWINNFYNKKVNSSFRILGFSGTEFDLKTDLDPINFQADLNKEPYLFISDLTNFIEQIYHPIPKSFGFENERLLNISSELDSIWKLVGILPSKNNEISIEDLERLQNIAIRRLILKQIDRIIEILDLKPEEVEEAKEEEEIKKGEEHAEQIKKGIKETFKEEIEEGLDNEGADYQDSPKPPDDQPPLKLSELDPQDRLYIQSLSIITINQALSKYFNEASLAKAGLPPGTVVTFDQLPLATRQQLMDRAFSQVENLLLSGQFPLDKLISEPAQRINFSNKTALGLLMDVQGLNLLNTAVREIANRGVEQIKANESIPLTEQQLSEKVKNEKDNVLNSKQAEKILEEIQANPNFAKIIESELNIISNENQLDDVFSKKIAEITNYQDNARVRLVIENVRPLIEVFIQQGLPPEYLIPDTKSFDYSRFVNVFGSSLDREVFNAHKEELAELIVFYWKRKRAIWATEIRQEREIALEKYTPEQAQKLFEEIKKDPQKLAQLRNLGTLNLTYGGKQIAKELAGLVDPSSQEMAIFQTQQRDLIEKNLLAEIAKLTQAEQQQTLKVFFDFYSPGTVYQEYNVEIFQAQIAPQINPMDFYMLQMAEEFGTGAFASDGSGYVQRAFAEDGDYQGTDFMDGALGQAGKKVAAKALSEGLYLALDAAGGWGEALRAAELAAPFLKQLKEQLIEMGLEKVIEFVKKNWPLILLGMILSALAALLPWLLLLAPAYFLLRNGLGNLKNLFSETKKLLGRANGAQVGLERQAALQNQLAAESSIPQGAKTLLGQYSSSAMATAGQAVLATVGITAVFTFIYQTSVNLAFLTDFPFNQSEISSSVEKTSKYAEIKKTAKIIKGCTSPENNGAKCENPSFPLSIEYTITIKPKEDFSLQITDIKDNIKFKQSKKGWEESGKPMPSIESQRALGFDYFKELIAKQTGLSNVPLNIAPSLTPAPTTNTSPTPSQPLAGGDFVIIPAGGSLTFSYTLDELDANYNHTAIVNTIEANFYYQNAFIAGTDNVTTTARVCLGECGGDVGCWPMTGTLSQMPFDNSYSHGPNAKNSYWHDAYDISAGVGPSLYGNMVYVPFDGQLCFAGCDNDAWGCRFILSFNHDGSNQTLIFAHFQDPNSSIGTNAGDCSQVQASFPIGLSGTRGRSSGNHLHYGAGRGNAFGLPNHPGSSIIETLVPADNKGDYPPKLGAGVTTCYE